VTANYTDSSGDTNITIGSIVAYESNSSGGFLELLPTGAIFSVNPSGIAIIGGSGVSPSAPTIRRGLADSFQDLGHERSSVSFGNYTTYSEGGIWDVYNATGGNISTFEVQPDGTHPVRTAV
jgi:hypothetical protein